MKKNHYDIVIVGAGMVGLLFASLLSSEHFRILLIDKKKPITEWDDQSYDTRVSAVTLATQRLFEEVDVWSAITAQRVSPFQKMHVWDAVNSATIDFNAESVGESHIGHIIENRVMQAALWKKVEPDQNIHFFAGELKKIQRTEASITLTLSDDQHYSVKLLVGADGAQSQVRQLAEIDLEKKEYGHTAVVATVETEKSHQATAWQCFLPTGPLAFLPLFDSHMSSIVWSTSPEEAHRLSSLTKDDFKQELSHAFSHRLGAIKKVSEGNIFPLRRQHAKRYIQERIALIGDAAHTIHPLAGQGVNMGFLDAASLVQVIKAAYEKKRDIGSVATLRRYERWRKSENALMLTFVDVIHVLFSRTETPISILRGMGLQMTDKIDWIKNYFMKRAMGLSEGSPDQTRGTTS